MLNNNKTLLNKTLESKEVFYDYFDTQFSSRNLTSFKYINTFDDFKTQFHQDNKNEIGLEINGVYLKYPLQIQYRYKDVVKGEIYKPFHIVPAVSVQFKQPVYISNTNGQKATVVVSNYANEPINGRSEEHTSELQSRPHLVCRLLLEK